MRMNNSPPLEAVCIDRTPNSAPSPLVTMCAGCRVQAGSGPLGWVANKHPSLFASLIPQCEWVSLVPIDLWEVYCYCVSITRGYSFWTCFSFLSNSCLAELFIADVCSWFIHCRKLQGYPLTWAASYSALSVISFTQVHDLIWSIWYETVSPHLKYNSPGNTRYLTKFY